MTTMPEMENGLSEMETKYKAIFDSFVILGKAYEQNKTEYAHKNLLYTYGKLTGAYKLLCAFYHGSRNDYRLNLIKQDFEQITQEIFGDNREYFSE